MPSSRALLRRRDGVDKRYLALVSGRWPRAQRRVEAPLAKLERGSGERVMRVSGEGKPSLTEFRIVDALPGTTLIEAKPVTGRTHQIRVHALHAGHPLLGDEKYANESSREMAQALGLRRLFLHAHSLRFRLGDRDYSLQAPLDSELDKVLEKASN